MGNSIGVIFHNNWEEISPFLYSHYGADIIPFEIQSYLREYLATHSLDNHDGHKYSSEHMIVGFIQSIDKDIHMRVESFSDKMTELLIKNQKYSNCFDAGCWIINVSTDHFGETVVGDNYTLENNNIVQDELKSIYDYD